MNLVPHSDAGSAPVHLWIVAILSALLNAFGLFDFAMTQLRSEQYMALYPPEQRDFFYSFPLLMDVVWGVGMIAGLAGSILLLTRKRQAVLAYAVALIGVVISMFWQFSLPNIPATLTTPAMVAINVIIGATAFGFLIYASRIGARQILH